MTGTVLIIGATGRFGRNAADAFWNKGWKVKRFDRKSDNLNEAAKDVDVIVNAWNPPYPEWEKQVPTLTRQVIEAARVNDATVIIPGNVYVYGAAAPDLLTANTLHLADNRLGRVRIEMEQAYKDADVKTIVLRAGDYIDTEASGNWFDGVITAKSSKGVFQTPGPLDVMHEWAYLPDVARAAVELSERRDMLERYEEVLYPGFALTLGEVAALVSQASGIEQKIRRFPWIALWLAAPFWKTGRGLLEMRYLWSMPHRLDGSRFGELLPNFRPTDPLMAIASAVQTDVDPDRAVARRGREIPAE